MTYAKIKDDQIVEYPVYEGDIRLLFNNVSFPTPFAAPEGYALVADVIPPQIDHTQNLAEGEPALVDGVWTRQWIVTDATPEQLAERTEAHWSRTRAERNTLLSSCDWWVTKAAETNATIGVEQHAYRQALRDITQQADPFNIIWPIEPIA
jgi:hypothetical protein